MIEAPKFEDIQKKFAELLASSPAKDIERNARALLTSLLGRMDLVTREEFDVQREVLARAREQLTHLEARIAELEAAQSGRPTSAPTPTQE